MGRREGGRFGRLFGPDPEPDGETVELTGSDAHAWWADRRSLSGTPTTARGAQDDPADDEPQADRFDFDALFVDSPFDPDAPPPPPPQDDGATSMQDATELDEARLILGVTVQAGWAEITKAHRALALQFHPDRLGGLSPEAQQLGSHRMAEINRAYDTLRAHQPA